MSLPTKSTTAAITPYSEAASLKHYSSKTVKELKVLAKIHGISDVTEPRDIVAILMEKDRVKGVWPGMFKDPETRNGEGSGVALAKQISKKTETSSETKIAAGGQSKSVPTATISSNNKITKPSTTTMAATRPKNEIAIPMPQLAKEWDRLWGPPFAFPKAATVYSKSQGTSVATAVSTPIRSKSPASPVSPASSASSKSNRHYILETEEKGIDISSPISVVEENDGAIVEPSPSVAPTQMDEQIKEQIFVDQFKLNNVEDTQESPSPIEVSVPQQPAISPPAAPSEPTVKPPKKAAVQMVPVAPPLPPLSTKIAPAPTPAKTKNQKRNEKRKENKQATLSNIYNVLMSDEPADASTPDSSNTKEDENKDNSEGAAPATKKNKRGTKGGKKAQAQKKHQSVPVVKTTTAPITETAGSPLVQAIVAGKTPPMHLALGAVVAILAGALGTWAIM